MEKIIKAIADIVVEEGKMADLKESIEKKQKELEAYIECLESTSLLDILANGGDIDIRGDGENHCIRLKGDVKYRVLIRIQPKSV